MIDTRTLQSETFLRRAAEFLGSTGARLSAVLLLLIGFGASQAQTIPTATASTSTLLTSINGNAARLSANSVGDVFYISTGDHAAYWLPRGTTTPVALVTGATGIRAVYVDPANNAYVLSGYSPTAIIEVPYVNGTYTTGTNVASTTPATCANATPTSVCSQFASPGAAVAYYFQSADMGMDAAGNAYFVDTYANGGCTGNCIIEFPRTGTTYGAAIIIKASITAQNYGAQITVAPNGDLYYAYGGSSVYYIANGSTSPVAVGTGLTNAAGVSSDRYGNIYITNSSSPNIIAELPALNGVAQASKQFVLYGTYSANGVAVDGLGDMYYTAYSGGTNLNVARLNSFPLGSSAVGTPVSANAKTITFTFAGSATVAGVTIAGSGFTYTPGSCAAGTFSGTSTTASTCNVNVNFTPTAVGLQRGAISLTSSTGVSLATALLSGIGQGGAETNDPGTLTAIGSGFTSPQGIAVDGSGNVYVADPGQNAVLRYAGGAGAPTSVGTGLSKPNSIALDGFGNLFIADSGNGRVVEVPNQNGTLNSSAQFTIIGNLGTTLGIAMGPYGDLYIADASKTTITKLGSLNGIPSTSATSTVGSKFSTPYALATDAAGNLFVADTGANTVSEITYLAPTTSSIGTTIGGGYSSPDGVAVDASGSVYIADTGNKRVVKVPLEGSAYNTNDQYLVGSTVAAPYGVALDASNNLYVTDSTNKNVNLITRTAGTLALGRAQLTNTTAASNAYIGNAGNSTYTFSTPAYTSVSAQPTYFAVTSPANGGCTNGGTVAAGYACLLSATFTPQTTGGFSDLLTFSDSAVVGAPKTLTITGTGINLTKTTTTLTQTSPSGTASFGQPVTIQATIVSSIPASCTPNGTMTFSVDGATQTNMPTVTNGTASITLTGLKGGQHSITGSYSGDANNCAPSSGNVTITIAQASTTTTLTLPSGLPQNPTSTTPGAAVLLTATIVPSSSTAPTGTVTFNAGSFNLGMASVAPNPNTGAYQATLSVTTLPSGSDTITATYSGDVNYATSVGTATILIANQTITVTPASSTTITVKSGQTGSTNLTVASISGFSGAGSYVGFTCSGLPANSSCAFNPNGFVLVSGAPQTVNMQIITGQTPIIAPSPVGASVGPSFYGRLSALLVLLALAPLGLRGRRRTAGRLRKAMMALPMLLLLGTASAFFSGCGNGSQFSGVTPSGTYTVTVTAASSLAGYTGTGVGTSCKVASGTLTCSPTTTITLVVQ